MQIMQIMQIIIIIQIMTVSIDASWQQRMEINVN